MSSDLMIVAEFLEGFKWYFNAPSKKSYGLFLLDLFSPSRKCQEVIMFLYG